MTYLTVFSSSKKDETGSFFRTTKDHFILSGIALSGNASTAPSAKDPPVDPQIEKENRSAEYDLNGTREAGRIDNGKQVVFYETRTVPGLSALDSQAVLERREGTDSAAPFDKYAPERGRQVDEGEPAPLQDQKSSEDDEKNKEEMDQNHNVGEHSVDHGDPPFRFRGPKPLRSTSTGGRNKSETVPLPPPPAFFPRTRSGNLPLPAPPQARRKPGWHMGSREECATRFRPKGEGGNLRSPVGR